MRHGDSLMEGRKIGTMKTNSFLTDITVSEKTQQNETEVISVTDLLMRGLFSHEG
jgi:hypothetical protein